MCAPSQYLIDKVIVHVASYPHSFDIYIAGTKYSRSTITINIYIYVLVKPLLHICHYIYINMRPLNLQLCCRLRSSDGFEQLSLGFGSSPL